MQGPAEWWGPAFGSLSFLELIGVGLVATTGLHARLITIEGHGLEDSATKTMIFIES